MSLISSEKGEHTVRSPFGYQLVYWRKGLAACEGEEWTDCEVKTFTKGFGWTTVLKFNQTEAAKLESFRQAMHSAFEAGRRQRSKEIRDLINEGSD